MTLAAGTRLGPYEVLAPLGSGGMGEVYRARDTRLGREVAVKVLPEDFAQGPERLRRFEQEARSASALSDPHIVAVFDVGEANGIHYFASELVEGSDLRHLLADGALPLKKALDLAGQIASGLAAAHEKGIVHRDLKPENILITKSGLVKIAGFGLAKLAESSEGNVSQLPTSDGHHTTAGVVMGTVTYMSPEQVKGLPVDHHSNIFSFGAVLYEMLTGQKAFERSTVAETMAAILKEEPPELSESGRRIPPALAHIVEHCLEKNPGERFQSMRDIAFALREAGSQPTGSTPQLPPEEPRSLKLFSGITRQIGLASAAVAVLAVAAALFLFAHRAPALTEKDTILLADVVNTTGDPVFDGTLKQALAVALGQSPYLNIFPETQVRETLRLMDRSPDERITRDIASEICERRGLKAMLLGSISSLGSHYVITLEAQNARTGDALAREQAEAASKEQVLATVDQAATRLRKHLGESLTSIQKFDAPLTQATTPSLEALRAYTLGRQENLSARYAESIPLFKRAVELDPNFASAYNGLAVSYWDMGDETGEAVRYAKRAFELRDRATERERLAISTIYHVNVTGDLDKWIETSELFTRTYPREASPRNNLAFGYLEAGEYGKAVEQASEGLRIDPAVAVLYSNLGWAFRALGRYDEARATFVNARARKLDYVMMHDNLYLIAFAQGDRAGMEREIQSAAGTPSEAFLLAQQADAEAYCGRFRQVDETVRRAVESARRNERDEQAAAILGSAASEHALAGDCEPAERDAAAALPNLRGAHRFREVDSVGEAAIAFSLCRDSARAESIVAELARRQPDNTAVNACIVPVVRAVIENGRGDTAGAVEALRKAKRYELGQICAFLPQYVRGQAYLRQRSATEALAEFQAIIDHRSVSPADILYPLAHLGLARAAALAGDKPKSRRAYQDFFALWKDADPDIPILQQARREYGQ
jgi:eukaryotic-like serine/threonine-protein kinase